MTHLVDSDVLIAYLLGYARAISVLAPFPRTALAISVMTYAEVYKGIYLGRDVLGAARRFRAFTRNVSILNVEPKVAREYARLSGELRRQGRLLFPPDLLIAATALTYNLTLVTYNRRHFTRVPGLTIVP